MNKEFIPYEQALELKELGFNKECLAHWSSGIGGYYIKYDQYHFNNKHWMFTANDNKDRHLMCTAPLYQQVFRWFRERYSLDYEITYAGKKGEYHAFVDEYIYGNNGSSPSVFSYEEAELACLKQLIEIIDRKAEAYI